MWPPHTAIPSWILYLKHTYLTTLCFHLTSAVSNNCSVSSFQKRTSRSDVHATETPGGQLRGGGGRRQQLIYKILEKQQAAELCWTPAPVFLLCLSSSICGKYLNRKRLREKEESFLTSRKRVRMKQQHQSTKLWKTSAIGETDAEKVISTAKRAQKNKSNCCL